MANQTQTESQKKAYKPMKVENLGSLLSLTQANTMNSYSDGGGMVGRG
jgi:hypothetical protein